MSETVEDKIEQYLKDKEYENDYIVSLQNKDLPPQEEGCKIYLARDGKTIVREYDDDDGDVLIIMS